MTEDEVGAKKSWDDWHQLMKSKAENQINTGLIDTAPQHDRSMWELVEAVKDSGSKRSARTPDCIVITSKNIDGFRKIENLPPPYAFEKRVISFLWDRRKVYRIEEIVRLKNSSIDGTMKLEGNLTIPFEIKFRMNWLKACQSTWQFGQFRDIHPNASFDTGIVFFDSFSADWARSPKASQIPNGWRNWYSDHWKGSAMTLHLFRLNESGLETYDDAMKAKVSDD